VVTAFPENGKNVKEVDVSLAPSGVEVPHRGTYSFGQGNADQPPSTAGSRPRGYVATAGLQARTPVNTTRAKGGSDGEQLQFATARPALRWSDLDRQ
jgi:hypothetical protein